MNQGAKRHSLKDRGNDLYETPDCATLALIRHELLPSRGWGPDAHIWEPAAGRGAIARHLIAAGFNVTMTDLVAHPGADPGITSGVDFLMESRAPAGCTTIVTNPPFKLGDEFIRHGLRLCDRVIVLLRLMALEGAGRSDIIDHHLMRVWVGRERLPFMHRDGWEGPRSSNSGAPFAWFVFDRAGATDGIRMHRISWRDTDTGAAA